MLDALNARDAIGTVISSSAGCSSQLAWHPAAATRQPGQQTGVVISAPRCG
jgi:hypothetical protein